MKSLINYINERLIINKNYKNASSYKRKVLSKPFKETFNNIMSDFNSCYKEYDSLVTNVSQEELIYNAYMQPVINIHISNDNFTDDFFEEYYDDNNLDTETVYLSVNGDGYEICFSMVVDKKELINNDLKIMQKLLKGLIKDYNIQEYSISFGFFVRDVLDDYEDEEYFTSKEIGENVIKDITKILDVFKEVFEYSTVYTIDYNSSNFNKFVKYYKDK